MKKFDLLVNLTERIQVIAGILALAAIAFIIPLQVFCRYVLNAPLGWVEDVATGLLLWLAYLGAAVLYKRKGLVTVEFFLRFFPQKLSTAISLIIDVMIGFLSCLIIIYAYQLTTLQMMSYSVGTGIPRGYFYSVPLLVNIISIFIYSLHAITKAIGSMAGAER
jgi:TRAP-type C4-dicarboxylate transport system permease small subunit